MELHQVRYFLALSETLNFTRAAETCHVTQPALTKAIQRLEAELGGPLVHRDRQATRLTPLGLRLLPFLGQTYRAAMAAKEHAACFMRQEAAPLRLGLMPLVPVAMLNPVLTEIADCFDRFSLTLRVGPTDQLAAAMADGELDAVLTPSPDRLPDRIQRWPLYQDHLCWLSRGTDMGRNAQQSLILPSGCVGEVADLLGEARIGDDHIAHAVDTGIAALVAAGLGRGVIAGRAGDSLPMGLTARVITETRHTVTLSVLAGRRAGPALDAFLKLCRARAWS